MNDDRQRVRALRVGRGRVGADCSDMTMDRQRVRAWREPGCPHLQMTGVSERSEAPERAGVHPGARDYK